MEKNLQKIIKDIDYITLCKDPAAVDTYILGKEQALPGFTAVFKVPLGKIGAIADGPKDWPWLGTPGLGLVGAPANADSTVKERVAALGEKGLVSSMEAFFGFQEFYAEAVKREITHIISDRDGILKEGDRSWPNEFKALAQKMGYEGNPYISVITGSSLNQNIKFMTQYGLDASLSSNPAVRKYPWVLLAENGIVAYNALTGETLNYCQQLNQELLQLMKGPFEKDVARTVEQKILPAFGLRRSDSYDDQQGAVFFVPKEAMVTFNIPRKFRDGREYRQSHEATNLRQAILETMVNSAVKLNIPYKVLQ